MKPKREALFFRRGTQHAKKKERIRLISVHKDCHPAEDTSAKEKKPLNDSRIHGGRRAPPKDHPPTPMMQVVACFVY